MEDLEIFTKLSIKGTSTSTPTIVAKAAPELIPKRVIDTATASSKKFEAAIIDPGQEIEYFCLKNFIEKAFK